MKFCIIIQEFNLMDETFQDDVLKGILLLEITIICIKV
jgi:hypothetical protein